MNSDAQILALTSDIQAEFSKALGLSAERLPTDLPFIDIGADSLMLAETLQDINRRYAVNIPIVEAYENVNTIDALTQYIRAHGKLPQTRSETPAPSPQIERPSKSSTDNADPRVHALISRQLELMQKQLDLLNSDTSALQSPPHTPEDLAPDILPPIKTSNSKTLGTPSDRFSAFKIDLSANKKTSETNFVEDFSTEYLARTTGSKSQTQRDRATLSDNRISAGFRPNLKDIIYPVLAEKAKGAILEDIDGNQYIDFTMGFGVHLFGHQPAFIKNAIRKQLETGFPIGPQSPRAGKLAKLICEMTGHDRLTFLNTGGEATMTALRLARAATGKDKVVIFKNSYHGTFDGFLARPDAQSGASRPASLGTPPSSVQDSYVLDYGTDAALAFIETHADTLAAVMVEPVQSRKPALQPKAFLKRLRELTQDQNIALIFDEVICGFRCDIGGAQAHFDVQSDLSVYGKVIGGGMPIGLVAGRQNVMNYMDGGSWQYGDESYPATPTIFHAGTFSKHPLTIASSEAVAKRLRKSGPKLIEDLNRKTEDLATRLDAIFLEEGVNIKIEYFSSLFRFTSPGNLDYFFYRLLQHGIYIWEGRNCFISTAHKETHFKALLTAVRQVCRDLTPQQLLPITPSARPQSQPSILPLSKSQQRFSTLQKSETEAPSVCNLSFGFLFTSPVDLERLQDAIKTALLRHESLTMAYDLTHLTQSRSPLPPPERVITQETIAADGTSETVDQYLRREQARTLDIQSGECVAVKIVSFQNQTTLLSLCVHHLACDGWGLNVWLKDIADCFNGGPDAHKLSAPNAPYEDWLKVEAKHQTESAAQDSAAFWREALTNKPRHPIAAKPGARLRLSLDPDISRNYIAKAKAENTTLFTALLSHFQIYLNLMQKDTPLPVIGIPFANRTSGTAQLVGNCVNLLPFIPERHPTPNYADILTQTKSKMSQLFQHSKRPYVAFCANDTTPINMTFNVEPITQLPAFDGQVPEIVMAENSRIEFDQMYNLFIIDGVIRLEIDYNPDIYDAINLRGKLNLFCKILETSLR